MNPFLSQLLTKPLSAESWPRPLRVAGLVLAWLALTIQFHTPVREVMAPTLDGSNYASYAYFVARGFQYGTEVVPMAGPYGFIEYGSVYSGDLFWTRVFGELLLNATLAGLTLWFFRQLRGSWLRWAWLAAHVIFTPSAADLPLEWILLLGGLYLLRSAAEPRAHWRDLPVIGALALVSLIKGTQLILGFATVGVVLGYFAWHRQWGRLLRLGAGYLLAVLLFWLLAGQNPLHLPAYLRGILELGGGYTDAMSIPTPPEWFGRTVLLSVSLAACLGWALWYRRHEANSVAMLLLLAGHTFVQWKHGIVRSDGHVFIYFNYAIVAPFVIHLAGWRLPPARAGDLALWRGGGLLAVALIVANWGSVGLFLEHWEKAPPVVLRRFTDSARHLFSLGEVRRTFEEGLRAEQHRHALPLVRAAVGRRPIDGFGYEQGLLLLNQLNYRPRPMGGGSFNVYTPWLMELNRRFLRDEARRPDFYLLRPQSIDERLVAADDGLALLEIIRRYQPVLVEHEHLLLAAAPPAPAAEARLIHRASVRFGENLPVPPVADHELLLTRFTVRPNWLGTVRAALYKRPPVFIEMTDRQGGSLGVRRIVPAMAASPFLLSPLLETAADFTDLYEAGAGRPVGGFHFSTPDDLPFAPFIDVEFLTVPRPVMTPAALAVVRARLRFPFGNLEPEFITPPFRLSQSVRYFHAPSEAVWPLTGTEREFRFHFGLDPEAYERGTTNGVDFIVELRGPSGGVRPVFQRSLRPRQNPADRGEQAAHMMLPIFAPGSRLVLRTGPGEMNDNSWDWSWVNQIALSGGKPYPAELFPGFNRVPDSADAENAAAIEADGVPALMLHVPGKVGFTLTGKERKLTLQFGFLSGAYTNGGQTPGGDIVVEVVRAGQPPHQIFLRRLQPVTVPADRGPQTASVDLAGIAEGDVLAVRTAPVPGGNASWGWTYLSRVVID